MSSNIIPLLQPAKKLSQSWIQSLQNTLHGLSSVETDVETTEETELEDETEKRIDEPWKVILYNDDIHSFDEVILQLCKATGCTEVEAERIAFEAHFKGKAAAYSGSFGECFKVASILREIQLLVEIEG